MYSGFTQKGMNQSTSSDWVDGKKIYTKTNLTPQGIKNYELLMKLGVGVKLVSVDYNKGVI